MQSLIERIIFVMLYILKAAYRIWVHVASSVVDALGLPEEGVKSVLREIVALSYRCVNGISAFFVAVLVDRSYWRSHRRAWSDMDHGNGGHNWTHSIQSTLNAVVAREVSVSEGVPHPMLPSPVVLLAQFLAGNPKAHESGCRCWHGEDISGPWLWFSTETQLGQSTCPSLAKPCVARQGLEELAAVLHAVQAGRSELRSRGSARIYHALRDLRYTLVRCHAYAVEVSIAFAVQETAAVPSQASP